MCGGGGSTTNVTETGLGDDQYANLTAGQQTIRDDISYLGDEAETRYDNTVTRLGDMADATEGRFDSVDNSLEFIGRTTEGGFADVLSGQDDLATDVDTRLSQTDENMATGFENLTNTVDTGLETVTNNVDTRTGEIQDNINTQFDNTNTAMDTGFSNLTDTVNTNDAVLLDATNTGFDTTNENIDNLGTTLGDQLTETSSNVLTGQDAISALIEKYGGDAATYYQDLARGQTAIQENQGTMQTAFDGYLSDFSDYTTLANQTRTDLGNSIVGGFETMGQVLGNQAEANAQGFTDVGTAVQGVSDGVADVTSDVATAAGNTETNFGDIAASIAGVGTDVEGVGTAVGDAADATDTNFGTIATDIASGFNDQSTEGTQRRNDFVDTLNSVQEILQADTGALDATVKANYQSVVDSFDAQGNLITDTVTSEGTTITRALSEQGDLFIAEFDTNGQRIAQQTLDINSLLNNVSTFETNMQEQFTGIFGDAEVAAESRQSILDAFNITDGLIGDLGTGVTDELTNNFDLLSAAFDEQGNFLADSIDENGNTITRSLDANGNLITQSFDSTNSLIDETSINVGDISTQLNNIETGLGDQLTSAFTDLASGNAEANANIVNILGQVDTKIGTVGTGLSSELSDNLDVLTESFDAQGNLIRQDIGANGETITRELDAQGNLITTAIGANGEVLSQNSINIAQVATDLNGVQTGLGDQLTSAFASLSGTNAEANAAIATTLDNIGTKIGSVGSGLSTELANNFTELSSAFDSQGNLIQESIGANGETITRELDEQGNLITTAIGANGQVLSQNALDIMDVATQLNGVEVGLGDQLASAFTALTTGSQDANTSILDTLSAITSQVDAVGTGIQSSLAQDFANLKSSFDEQGNLIRSEITEAGTEIRRDLDSQGNLITTELSQTGEVISQTSLNISDISTQLNGMQAGLGDTITNAFTGIQNSSDELRANLIGNLDGLRKVMVNQGDQIGADLQEKFMALSSSFDENGDLIRSSVDANGDFIFRELNANGELVISTIDDATGQLLEAEKFNANMLTTDFDSRFNTADEFLQAIDASIQQVGGDIDQGLLSMASGLEEGFTSRFDELSEEERAGRQEFNNRLLQVRALLEEDVADLDDGLRGRMTELSRAFDGEGKLIANAIDANGNMLKRTIDDSGQLLLSTYSRINGQLLDQQALDINRLMKEISNRRVVQGSNANMGGQSPTAGAPAPASVYSGFASPYAQTY